MPDSTKKRLLQKRIITVILTSFILMNVVAFFHAYKFTHFADSAETKTKSPEKLGSFEKIKTLLLGVNNPRPENTRTPSQAFRTIRLQSNKVIEGWYVEQEHARGTVLIFHGYSGRKSSMLDKSDEFLALGYNTLLVDFMGSGGSESNQTTLGFKEAEEVKTAFEYVESTSEKNIFLFGTSMGAAAVLKALHDYPLDPAGVVIECPFGSMYQTTCARFLNMGAPAFPMAGLLVFWGGLQNGFWALEHNPVRYAERVHCPTLLLYGKEDKNVSLKETQDIYATLRGPKTLQIYEHAGHENYLRQYRNEWVNDVRGFMDGVSGGSGRQGSRGPH